MWSRPRRDPDLTFDCSVKNSKTILQKNGLMKSDKRLRRLVNFVIYLSVIPNYL